MSSGIQEIFLIVVILLAILFIPRIMSPKRGLAPKRVQPWRRLMRLNVWWRLALVVSLLWLLGSALYFRPWQGSPEKFLIFGLGLVLIGWCFTWVVAGFVLKKKKP